MIKDISLRQKYRAVMTQGKLTRAKGNNYTFTAFPGLECPVQMLSKKGRWQVIEEVYQLIQEYN
jgi:hypothetical protein